MKARLGQDLPVGNEGSGTVVAAGSDDYAQSLMGKRVAVMGGGMYGGYRAVPAMNALPLPKTASVRDGASCFVNPLTALCFVETMRGEGHTALVHTAAASNLGQMLNRICQSEDIDIVNIVRKPEQVMKRAQPLALMRLAAGIWPLKSSSLWKRRRRVRRAPIQSMALSRISRFIFMAA